MYYISIISFLKKLIPVAVLILVLSGCSGKVPEGMVIVTKIPVEVVPENSLPGLPVYEGSSLMAFFPDNPQTEPRELTAKLYSACSPDVFYDGTRILFSGQMEEDAPWQIFELNLYNGKIRQVTHSSASCFTPYYLPGDKLTFSKELPDTGTGVFRELFTMNLDGTGEEQITFHPNSDHVGGILRDGRILMLSQQVYPDLGPVKLLAIRPNGTKAELFYKPLHASLHPATKFRESETGDIYFCEYLNAPLKKEVPVRIRYNRPLHSRTILTQDFSGSYYSASPGQGDDLLVSYRNDDRNEASIYTLNPATGKMKELLFLNDNHLIEPLIVQAVQRPRKLPNELIAGYPTGLMMSQNVNITTPGVTAPEKASRLEILGIDRSLGSLPLEADGSFYIKVPADMPFRLRTLDDKGHVIMGPSDWYWVRPFERRGCVGCHEDPELSPNNVVPLAIKDYPVSVPVDTSGEAQKAETFKVSNMK